MEKSIETLPLPEKIALLASTLEETSPGTFALIYQAAMGEPAEGLTIADMSARLSAEFKNNTLELKQRWLTIADIFSGKWQPPAQQI